MILVIDNYDSFVHNLARYCALAGWEYAVVRNDALTIDEIKAMSPEAIILSPGPCTPAQAGICVEVVKRLGSHTPILGVCLGHQAIGEAYGARTIPAKAPLHGKTTTIAHNGIGLFQDLPSPIQVGRYHSLITLIGEGSDLLITAQSTSGTIMAMEHKHYPVYGVQFHPESVLTEHGLAIIKNFAKIARNWNSKIKGAAQA